MSAVASQFDHDALPDTEMTAGRALAELATHRDCPTSVCRRRAQAKAVLAASPNGLDPTPVEFALPDWVKPGGQVVELSQTRGIVLSRLTIEEITDTEIVLRGGYRYRIATMHISITTGHVVFTRQNPFLPHCRLRLAGPTHPDARPTA
ncbi:hypothetical protein ACWIGI_10475 [Nocardia sp. NPDC055321]